MYAPISIHRERHGQLQHDVTLDDPVRARLATAHNAEEALATRLEAPRSDLVKSSRVDAQGGQQVGLTAKELNAPGETGRPSRRMSALMVEIIHSIRDEELRELAAHRGKEGC